MARNVDIIQLLGQLRQDINSIRQQQEEQRQELTETVQQTVATAITETVQQTVATAITELSESLSGQLTDHLQNITTERRSSAAIASPANNSAADSGISGVGSQAASGTSGVGSGASPAASGASADGPGASPPTASRSLFSATESTSASLSPGSFIKLPLCGGDPFEDKDRQGVLDWLEMAIALAGEAEEAIGRHRLHHWLLTKIQSGNLQNQVKASARELPKAAYDAVLVDVRDRIAGVTDASRIGRWQEAALSIRQAPTETLTELLPGWRLPSTISSTINRTRPRQNWCISYTAAV